MVMKKPPFFCFVIAPIKHAFLTEHTVTCYSMKNTNMDNDILLVIF